MADRTPTMRHIGAAIERLAAHQAALAQVHADAAQRAAQAATAPPPAPGDQTESGDRG